MQILQKQLIREGLLNIKEDYIDLGHTYDAPENWLQVDENQSLPYQGTDRTIIPCPGVQHLNPNIQIAD